MISDLTCKYELFLKLISINQIIQNNQINQINWVTLVHHQTVTWVNMMILRGYQFMKFTYSVNNITSKASSDAKNGQDCSFITISIF